MLYEDGSAPQDGMYPSTSLSLLHACLNSSKLCLDTLYLLPLSTLVDLPYTSWTLLGHAIVVLSKLSLLQAEGWDEKHVQNVLDFPGCMDRLARRFEEAKALAGTKPGYVNHNVLPRHAPQLLLKLPSTLQRVKVAHEAMRVRKTTATSQTPEPSPMLSSDDFDVPLDTSFFEFLDEDYWDLS